MFTDYYAEQSCTAGRSTFITGQCDVAHRPFEGRAVRAPRSACRPGTSPLPRRSSRSATPTGQFGKNHLGDRDEYLPTNHGFDEFFGNLYHLNAEEEPENHLLSEGSPEFRKRIRPRGVLKTSADGKIEDTGPLTKKRMETIDDETTEPRRWTSCDRQVKANKPFFSLDEHDPHALSARMCARMHRDRAGTDVAHRICRRHDRA